MSGGTIQTGTGTLYLSANTTITTTNSYATYISGNLNKGSGTLPSRELRSQSVCKREWFSQYRAKFAKGYLVTFWSGRTPTRATTPPTATVVYLGNSLALGNTNNTMTLNGHTYL